MNVKPSIAGGKLPKPSIIGEPGLDPDDPDHDPNDDDYFDYDDDLLDDDDQDLEDDEGEDSEEMEEEAKEEDEEHEGEEEGSEDEDSEEEEGSEGSLEEKEIPLDEVALELRARKMSIVTFAKEELILSYLQTMRRVRRLRRHNLYLQDYLYRLLLRKKLITEEVPRESTSATSIRAANRLKRHKKKVDAKMRAHFDIFRSMRPPSEGHIDTSHRRPTREMLKRARRLARPDREAPEYLRKLDIRAVYFQTKLWQRIFRSKTRDWNEEVLDKEDAKEKRGRIKGQNHCRKLVQIPHGHPDVPEPYQRTVTPFHQLNKEGKHRPKTKGKRIRTRIAPTSREYEMQSDFFEKVGRKPCKGAECRNRSITDVKSVKSNSKSNIMNLQPERNKSMASLNLEKEKKSVSKCKKKHEKGFQPLHWFIKGRLIGRKISGKKLQPVERQHLINFVNRATLLKKRKSSEYKPAVSTKQSVKQEWHAVIRRLYQLLERNFQTEKIHEETMKRKMVEWSLWEKRNLLTIQGLFNIFREFILQSYFSPGEKRSFRKDIVQFGDQLHRSHSNLMTQLYRMYRSKVNLLLLQRKVKDSTNQALLKQGYTLADFELRRNENRQLYQALVKREGDLETQSDKLAWTIKQVNITRDTKEIKCRHVSDASTTYKRVSENCDKGKIAAAGTMHKYYGIIEKHKGFLLQAAMVERKNLLHDFTTRKKAMAQFELEVHRRSLTRSVYLKEREINLTRVKTNNMKRNAVEKKEFGLAKQNANNMRLHKDKLAQGFPTYIKTVLDNCPCPEEE